MLALDVGFILNTHISELNFNVDNNHYVNYNLVDDIAITMSPIIILEGMVLLLKCMRKNLIHTAH